MSLPEITSIIAIADFCARIVSLLKRKKKKKRRKAVPRQRKQTKEEALITKLLIDPEMAIKEMGAEYVVKNRKRILKNLEKRVVEEFF